MPPPMRILTPREAVEPLLASPVIALDTEFKGDSPCRASLNGLSLAGGNLKDGLFAAFWPFGPYGEVSPWGWLRDRVLLPILTDPNKLVVMHPWKVDAQLLHPRGIPEEVIRCRKADTMAMAHITDENLPKGLKDLAWCLLGVSDVASHAETQKEMKGLVRAGVKESKAVLRGIWNTYRVHRKGPSKAKRKTSAVAVTDPLDSEMPARMPRWHREALHLPLGLTRVEVIAACEAKVRGAIEGDYASRAHARFARYGAEDALFTLGVYFALLRELPEEHADILALEQEVSHPIVTEMEEAGLLVDVDRLSAINDAMTEAVTRLREKVMREWGITSEDVTVGKDGEWNPGSPDQVAQILWRKWKLRPPPWAIEDGQVKPKFARSKDGLCSTDKDVMRWLGQHAPAPFNGRIRDLIELRRYVKLQGKDVQGLLDLVMRDPERRAHASFWPTGARTGRFTADNPNVENIPRPTTMPVLAIPEGADPATPPPGVDAVKDKKSGKVIWRIGSLRKVFIAPPGWSILSADLSQIENRLMAHHSEDTNLLRLYRGWDCAACGGSGETDQPLHACPSCGAKDGKRDKTQADQPAVTGFCLGRDIHAFTAVRLGYYARFGPEVGRDRGKTTNHAATYGMSGQTMARRDDIPVREADKGLAAWHETFPGVHPLHEEVRVLIRDQGYVEMFDGHRRRFPIAQLLVRSHNFRPWEWEGVVREGVNVLCQGGTGVVVKRAMIAIRKRLRAHTNKLVRAARLLNQVHDELVYEAPAEAAVEVLGIVKWELEHAAQLRVPVIADGAIGPTWGDAK